MNDAKILFRGLLVLAICCAFLVLLWPEPVCRACGAEVLRERASMEGRR